MQNRFLELSKEQETKFEDLLTKLFNTSLKGLYETLHEVNYFRRNSQYYSNLHHTPHLKQNFTLIQEPYDFNIQKTLNEIKEQKEILFNTLNQSELIPDKAGYVTELISQIDYTIDKITDQVLLTSIFSTIGLFNSIETITALFTGTGVLGIAPLRMGFVINSTASEMMFIDKLEELERKLTYTIHNVFIRKKQQLDQLNLYFNLFRKNIV